MHILLFIYHIYISSIYMYGSYDVETLTVYSVREYNHIYISSIYMYGSYDVETLTVYSVRQYN